jgi:hypothetical protein
VPVPDLPPRLRRAPHELALVALALAVVVLAAVVFAVTRDPDGSAGGDARATPSVEPVVPPSGGAISGQEYAVSPFGNDNTDGSADRPWRTLGHALAQLGPGDRLTVGDGEYEEDIDLDVRPGRTDEPVQVVAAADARPVVVGLLWLADLSYWDVRGINVTWDDSNSSDEHMVKLTDGTGWRFGDAELWGAKSFAALLVDGEPEDFLLSGLFVHDTHPANDTNQDHLIYLNSGTGGGVIERSVLAHSANGRALKIGAPSSGEGEVANIVVRYVTMVDNRGPSNVQLAYDTSDVVIENSLMVGADEGRANVTTFDLDGSGNVVRNSLGWDSSALLDGSEGLEDGGGNVRLDPQLTGRNSEEPYRPTDPAAQAFGRWAPGA